MYRGQTSEGVTDSGTESRTCSKVGGWCSLPVSPALVCGFITAVHTTKLCSTYYKAGGGRGIGEDMCYVTMRVNEPRPVWTSLPITH